MDTIIADLAQYGFILSFALAFAVWLGRSRREKVELVIAGAIGGLACLALIKLGGSVFYDTRPFVAHHVAPLFPHARDNGFPSDHTAVTMFIGFCLLVVSRRWGLVLIALSLVAGIARVLAHVHSPVDIVGATAIGAAAAALGWLLTHRLVARWPRLMGTVGGSPSA